MEELSKYPRLTRRGQVYWFRAKVPADLRAAYAPKREITFSLRTTVYSEAVEKVRIASVKLDQEFAAKRRALSEQAQTDLTDVEIERLAAIYFHHLLEEDEQVRLEGTGSEKLFSDAQRRLEGAGVAVGGVFVDAPAYSGPGLSDREFEKAGETIEGMGSVYRAALARGHTQIVEDEVDDLLDWNELRIDKTSPSYRKLSHAILKATVEANEALGKRQQGHVVETPAAPIALASREAALGRSDLFSAVFEGWRRAHHGPEKTKREFGVQVRRFIEVNGDLPIGEYTPTHVRDFKDMMLRMPCRLSQTQRKLTVQQIVETTRDQEVLRLSPRTVREKSVAAVRAIFGYAVDNRYRPDNPASGIKVAVSSRSARRATYPFSVDELSALFTSPVFTKSERPPGGGGEAAKWLPLLALFTGARLEELAQLLVQDIRIEDGVRYIFIGADPELQSYKTEQSRRKTPLHPELVALGFLDYLASVEAGGHARVFPDLHSENEKISAAWSKWFGRYRKRCGIVAKGKVFHSFRHTFKRGLREVGVEKTLRDALMGHAHEDDAEEYGLDEDGIGVSLPCLYGALCKLEYPGLDITHLHEDTVT